MGRRSRKKKKSKNYCNNPISASLNVNWNLDPKSSSPFCMEGKTHSKVHRHWLIICLVCLGLRETRLEDLCPGGLGKRHLLLISQKDNSIWECVPENSGYVCSFAQAWHAQAPVPPPSCIFPVLGVVACILLTSVCSTSPLAWS